MHFYPPAGIRRSLLILALPAALLVVVGCSSLAPAPTPSPSVPPTQPTASISCRDWRASYDASASTLHVTGTCQAPTAGYKVELRRKAPQGINPRDLLLEKVATPPTGVVAQVITNVDVSYEEQTEVKYDTVTILPDGVTLPVGSAG